MSNERALSKEQKLTDEINRLRLIINGPVSNELLVESLSFIRAGFPETGLDLINRIERFLRDNPVPEWPALVQPDAGDNNDD